MTLTLMDWALVANAAQYTSILSAGDQYTSILISFTLLLPARQLNHSSGFFGQKDASVVQLLKKRPPEQFAALL